MVQTSRIGKVAAGQRTDCDCPNCGQSCRVEINKREVHSMDGPVELIETVAPCRRCRRSFFPQRRFFPQCKAALGLDPRESTPGFKRQMIVLNAETRSFKRASIVMKRVVGLDVSPNTIERIVLEVGNDLEVAAQEQWQSVLTGEVTVPSLAIVEFDGGRIQWPAKPTGGDSVKPIERHLSLMD